MIPAMTPAMIPDGAPAPERAQVLLVDDEAFQLDLLRRIMAALGYRHLTLANDGAQAIERINGGASPDLIVTDLKMPVMDGVEMLRQIGERGVSAAVILVSAHDPNVLRAAETVSRSFDLDVLGALEKPVSKAALEMLLRQWRRGDRRLAGGQGARVSILDRAALDAHLAAGHLIPFFQPKVGLADDRVVGAEALARLSDGADGFIPPAAFVDQVERDPDMALAFTAEMARRALGLLSDIPAGHDPGKIAVNLPATCLARDGVFDRLRDTVASIGVDPAQVVFEVTEAAAIENFTAALQVLTRLRLAGFGLAIDDYGTGHSSLERLATIPFSEVKIDRAFVRGCTESPSIRKILSSAIALVKDLGMTCVAEGAETDAELSLLADLGCDVVQGFAISPPLAPDAYFRWLAERDRPASPSRG